MPTSGVSPIKPRIDSTLIDGTGLAARDGRKDRDDVAVGELLDFADNPRKSPEARLLCGALLKAMYERAEDARATRPHVNFTRLAATLAGLASKRWESNVEHTTLLDPRPGVARETPLDEE